MMIKESNVSILILRLQSAQAQCSPHLPYACVDGDDGRADPRERRQRHHAALQPALRRARQGGGRARGGRDGGRGGHQVTRSEAGDGDQCEHSPVQRHGGDPLRQRAVLQDGLGRQGPAGRLRVRQPRLAGDGPPRVRVAAEGYS